MTEYTYDSFVTSGDFTLLRPVFLTMLLFSLGLFFFIVIPKLRKLVNGLAVTGVSIAMIIVSAQLLYFSGIIVDELGLGGDITAANLFIAILILGMANPLLWFYTSK
ncbi:hypothetical protein MUN89_20560 [Halobacillus salinarum]|uniref:Uncharacterized protein n=1 Tax=Halobacillus salinarum TaxID=2932257 RepID=A0ABY4EQ42_9BACI|nr:hypothetical protein [Halobacillus salinarum]UOQ44216.1 hypothetical protein MUN89_20560 [Halobacillus salinarum]